MDEGDFFKWERTTRDVIAVRRVYVDMAVDINAGLMLSQIIYWNTPDKTGKSKLRVFRNGYYWLVKADNEWWEEIRLTYKQAFNARKKLTEKQLIMTDTLMFKGRPAT